MTDAESEATRDLALPPESELAFVSDLLAALPRPVIPLAVAALLATISDQPVAEATLQPSTSGNSSSVVVAFRRRRVMPWLAAAAVVLLLGGVGVRLSATSGVTQSSATSELTQLSNRAVASLNSEPMAPASAAAVGSSTTDTSAPQPSVAGFKANQTLAGTFAESAAGTSACLVGLGQSDANVRLVFATTYQGQAAVALVVTSQSGGSKMFVVGPDCSTAATHLLATSDLPSSPTPAAT